MNLNLDYTRDRLIAALNGFKEGKGLDDAVGVPTSFGKQTNIREALRDANRILVEPFHAEHVPLVDTVFARFGEERPSIFINDCAAALLIQAFEPERHGIGGSYIRLRDGKSVKFTGRYAAKYPSSWEAYIWLADDKISDVFKDARCVLSGLLPNIPISDRKDFVLQEIEHSIESCHAI